MPFELRTAAIELNVAVVVMDCDIEAPVPVGRSTSVCAPDPATAVSIDPDESDWMTTIPSINTSTGVVKALMTRSPTCANAQHAVGASLPQAAIAAGRRNSAIRAGSRTAIRWEGGMETILASTPGLEFVRVFHPAGLEH